MRSAFLRSLRRRGAPGARRIVSAGFSLLEMMIVITIILILASIAAGRYEKSVLRAKEATLKQDLFIMRNAIQQYTLDKEAGPVVARRSGAAASTFPQSPRIRSRNNKDWKTESEQVLLDPLQTSPGITDVHSSSDQTCRLENTPYSSW